MTPHDAGAGREPHEQEQVIPAQSPCPAQFLVPVLFIRDMYSVTPGPQVQDVFAVM